MKIKFINTIILLYICSVLAAAQKYTISGYIKDAASGEPLIGATVFDKISKKGTVANAHGFYSLAVNTDSAKLQFSFVAYSPLDINLAIKSDTVFSPLLSNIAEISEITIAANKNNLGVKGTQMSAVDVPISQIKNIPSLAGEVDVIKAIQLMPGVQSGSEGATGLYVRGGGPDQNLILLDGVPLYNINHLFGFFSVFNADAIKNITLYKGNFPARFGSRLSSVLDIRQNEGNNQKYHGNITVGILSAKMNVEGPIVKNKTSFNFSARRSYFDLLLQPIMAIAQRNETQKASIGYYFYDINTKVTHKFSDKNKISASFYMGDDAIYSNIKEKISDIDQNNTKLSWDWGNLLASINWAHKLSKSIFSDLTIAYSRYRYNVAINNVVVEENYNSNSSIEYFSNIQDIAATYIFDFAPNPDHTIKFGANYIFHMFKPEVGSMKVNTENNQDIKMSSGGEQILNHEANLFFEDNWAINNKLNINMGIRASLYATKQRVYPSVEPRLGFRALIYKDLSFKASYSYMNQYIHLLSNSNITMPTDLWVPVTDNIKPMNAHHAAIGFFYNLLDNLDFSAEAYYKHMYNIIEYKDGASFFANSQGWEQKVNQGIGWSYGIELLAQRKIGNFTGWIAYTWSKNQRKFDRPGMIINDGKPFFAKYDRRHDISVVSQYKINKIIDISATFVYGTGTRASLGSQEYMDGDGFVYEYIPERNNYKLPDYWRIDIGANFHKQHKHGKSIVNISIYNLTNRNNPFFVYEQNNKFMQMSIFPILPSISYTYKF